MTYHYFSPVDGVVGLAVNESAFRFSYGQAMPPATKQDFDKADIRIRIEIVKDADFPSPGSTQGKFHYFSANSDEGSIFYDRHFLFGRRLKLAVSGLHTNDIHIVANKSYQRFVKHRFMNLHSVGYIATDLVNLRLLNNGYCPLHCSAVAVDGKAYLIFAPPNTGKTLSSMQLCMQDESIGYMAEDLAVTDGDSVYAVPWTSTFRYYTSINDSRRNRFLNWLTDRISILELVSRGEPEPITNYIDANRIAHRAPIGGVFILERGERAVEDLALEDAAWRVSILNQYEFNHLRAPAAIAYEYFNFTGAMDRARHTERECVERMLGNAALIKVIRHDDASQYATEIQAVLTK